MKRTMSMELRAIREKMNESPPPPPQGTSIRDWFAGLALSSPILMRDIPIDCRAKEAVRLADDLLAALAAPRVPSQESLAAPSEAEMVAWDQHVAHVKETKEIRNKATMPAIGKVMPAGTFTLPPPAPSAKPTSLGRYSVLTPAEPIFPQKAK